VKDKYLAMMFLVNSDRQRYGSLICDIKNKYTRGSDTYPTTLSMAYDYIVNYRLAKTCDNNIDEQGGVAFYTRGNEDDLPRSSRGRGRNGGCEQVTGKGPGRHGHGSRQQSNKIPAQDHMH
jgi:hypothetical protein